MPDLHADCSSCAALCCVALPLTRSADFAIDKPSGEPCRNLDAELRCTIHADLRGRGFPGCVAFDCFGAGQQVTRVTFAGSDWRTLGERSAAMFASFATMRALHEMLWYLAQAHRLGADVDDLTATIEAHTAREADALAVLDVAALRARVGATLAEVSARVRGSGARSRRGQDLAGRDLRSVDLRRADLRGALLMGADLRGADLHLTDLLGADLRGADVRGARLADTLFLTSPQSASARGDTATSLPREVERPAHWG